MSLCYGQQVGGLDLRFRLAQSYEQSGEYEAAIKIYQDLLAKDPSNNILLEALRRSYMQLKMYDKAIVIVRQQLQKNPSDINLHCQLASIYYVDSSESKAVEEWERALAISPQQPGTYQTVANSITQNRLFDRSIGIFLRGRKACNDPNLFITDLASLYAITSKYGDATKEYVSLVKQNPLQTGYAQTQIGAYTNHPEGLAAATKVIEESAASSSGNLNVLGILAWIYMEGKHYDRALNVYKSIDDKSNAGGHELQIFAQRALHDRSFTIAATAFHEILDRYPSFDHLADIKFGYAQSIEASDEERDTLRLFGHERPLNDKQPSTGDISAVYSNAVRAYNDVVKEFPATEHAARSTLRIAILRQEKFTDLIGARQSLEELVKTYSMFPQVTLEGLLRLGDVYLSLDMIDKAASEYRTIAGRGLRINPLQEQAAMKLAEIEYFKGNFDTALSMLGQLTRNVNADVANDAIGLQIFIEQNLENDKAALQGYARADLLRRQRKYRDALSAYQSIMQSFPKSGIAEDAAASIGDIYTLLSRYADAISSYERLITDAPESISLDRTVMKMAWVYQNGLKDSAKAIAAYQKLLEQFPSSIYSSEARKRIRELRGDTI